MQKVLTDEQSAFVAENARLAFRFARDWYARYRGHLDCDEIESAALQGLCQAAIAHDPGRKTKFSTTAYFWMRHFVGRAEKASCVVHVPDYVEFRGKPEFREAARKARKAGSLPLDGELIAARPEAEAFDADDFRPVREAMRRLDRRTRDVLERVVMRGETIRATGSELGLSHERVKQIKSEGLSILRSLLS